MLTSSEQHSNKERGTKKYSLIQESCKSDFLCFDVFFKEGPFAILVLNKTFHVIRINGRFDYIFGLKGSELASRDIFEFLDTEDALRLKDIFENREPVQKPLLINLGFRQKGKKKLNIDTFIKKFNNSFNEPQYCLLLFDKEFYPHHHWVELQKEVYKAIVDTQEHERSRIGQHLHDSVAQTLYAIKLNFQHIMDKGMEDTGEVDSIKGMLNEAIKQIRNISTDLVPAVLQDFGLKAAIQFMVKRLIMPDFDIQIRVAKKVDELEDDLKLAIYRIVQELLNNCLKHSSANQVEVKVYCEESFVRIQVKDNGLGFSESLSKSMEKGIGLRNIKNRIDLYQGEISVENLKIGSIVEIALNTVIE